MCLSVGSYESTYVFVCVCVCVYANMYVCMYICMYVFSTLELVYVVFDERIPSDDNGRFGFVLYEVIYCDQNCETGYCRYMQKRGNSGLLLSLYSPSEI